ncbi:ABC transporter substrate-binding protein [Pantoea sp. AS-PWVM4]|uniref:ABC transporter substrate-binding protein n=1 Tax=Pantoea sp. AS-PWVM4 TaxID=1332069 RepID=UPI00056377DD|nr:ABC transporter substrate-binding protein [Pantoea sp. AS-PWVM4]
MRRRTFLQTIALLPLAGMACRVGASSLPAPRLVVLDWGLVETLLAIGVVPVGVAEIAGYHDNVVTPVIPAQVPDVGLRLAPNLEWLQQLAPDYILINSSQESQRAMLERIAPVRAFAIYSDSGTPYQHAITATHQLGELCQQQVAAARLIAEAANALQPVTQPRQPDIPLFLIRFFDARHIGIYGQHSLFQDVLDALGLTNGWHQTTDYWGISVTGLDSLAVRDDARILYFTPLPTNMTHGLTDNALWQALPAVQAGHRAALPAFWGFGMLPSAIRFAQQLSAVLAA